MRAQPGYIYWMLEVYRGTDLLLSTSSSMANLSISSTTRGADRRHIQALLSLIESFIVILR